MIIIFMIIIIINDKNDWHENSAMHAWIFRLNKSKHHFFFFSAHTLMRYKSVLIGHWWCMKWMWFLGNFHTDNRTLTGISFGMFRHALVSERFLSLLMTGWNQKNDLTDHNMPFHSLLKLKFDPIDQFEWYTHKKPTHTHTEYPHTIRIKIENGSSCHFQPLFAKSIPIELKVWHLKKVNNDKPYTKHTQNVLLLTTLRYIIYKMVYSRRFSCPSLGDLTCLTKCNRNNISRPTPW